MKRIKRCMALVLALLLAMGATGAMAASKTVKINKANFPDPVFRKYVKAEFDANKDGKLSSKEIKAVDCIEVSGMGIADLKGIAYFTELEQLYCSDNKLTSMNLNSNKKLLCLECANNKLTSLKVNKLKKLENIICVGNKKLAALNLGANDYLVRVARKELMRASKSGATYGYGKDPALIVDVKLTLKSGKTVLRKYGKPTKVAFTKSSVSVKKGWFSLEEKGVFIKMTPATAVYPVKITSSARSKVSNPDGEGFYEAKKKGKATLTITCAGKTGKLKVTVK